MKKTLLSAALIASFGIAAFAPQTARAVDGTITFNGKVLNSTCSVSNAVSNVVAVTLPDVQSTAFTASGSVAGLTPFSLVLTGCPTTPSGVVVGAAFSGGSIDSVHAGTITNTGTSNVNVQMTDSSGTALNLSTNSNPVNAVISGTGTATLGYKAQYYQPTATAITAGTVTASVSYTLTYN
jgi:major type 1 subunit fimbrin (pilin)